MDMIAMKDIAVPSNTSMLVKRGRFLGKALKEKRGFAPEHTTVMTKEPAFVTRNPTRDFLMLASVGLRFDSMLNFTQSFIVERSINVPQASENDSKLCNMRGTASSAECWPRFKPQAPRLAVQ